MLTNTQDSHNNLSLLQHDFKETEKKIEKDITYKVSQVSKTSNIKKVRDQQRNLKQNEVMHRDIFNTIVTKLNYNKIRIYDLYKLVQEYDFTINYETIDHIFRLCDTNKDYALDYQEYLGMINSGQANKVYVAFAKIQVKEKLRVARRISRLDLNKDEQVDSKKHNKIIPMTLQGFFFHVAHMICRSDLHNFASNQSNSVGERFEAMFNLLKYNQKNNIMQLGEDNYDEELKQKYLRKAQSRNDSQSKLSVLNILDDARDSQVLNTTRFMKLENSLSQICNSIILAEEDNIAISSQRSYSYVPVSKSQASFSHNYKFSRNVSPHNPELEQELKLLVENAKNQGQSEAITEYNQSCVAEPQEIHDYESPLNHKRPKYRCNLHLPIIPHSFGDKNGTIKKQYQLPSLSAKFTNIDLIEFKNQQTRTMPITILERMGIKSPINFVQKQKDFKDLLTMSKKDIDLNLGKESFFQDIQLQNIQPGNTISLIQPFTDHDKSQTDLCLLQDLDSVSRLKGKKIIGSTKQIIQITNPWDKQKQKNISPKHQKIQNNFNDDVTQKHPFSLENITIVKNQSKSKTHVKMDSCSQTNEQ